MGALRRSDLLGILEFVRSLENAPSLASFRDTALRGFKQLVPYDVAGYTELAHDHGSPLTFDDPPGSMDDDVTESWSLFFHEHPTLQRAAHTGDGKPHTISEFLRLREFRRLNLHDAVFRPLGVDHQLSFAWVTGPTLIGIALNRRRPDYSERERQIAELMRPHIGQGYRNTLDRELLRAVGETQLGHVGVVLMSGGARVLDASTAAQRLMAAYFEAPQRGLPEDIARWIDVQRTRLNGASEIPHRLEALTVRGTHGRLAVRFLPAASPDEPERLLLEERADWIDNSALAAVGLTRRECDVVRCLARGLVDQQIADELSIKVGTARKHLEHIYGRLGVHNRAAALARVIEISDPWARAGLV